MMPFIPLSAEKHTYPVMGLLVGWVFSPFQADPFLPPNIVIIVAVSIDIFTQMMSAKIKFFIPVYKF